MTTELVTYVPRDIGELTHFADRLSKAQIVPAQYRGKPNDVFAACLWGWETAQLTPMIALNYIDVIQGKAAYKSEGLVGVAMRKGFITDIEEVFSGEGDDYAATVTVTKANGKTLTRRFSIADAKAAGLYGKDNWKKWLDRMLLARARGFAVRDAAPHAMLSYTAEEVRDFDQPHIGPERARDITPAPAPRQRGEVEDPARKAELAARARQQNAPSPSAPSAQPAVEAAEPTGTTATGQPDQSMAEELDHVEPDEWKQAQGRIEDARQSEMLPAKEWTLESATARGKEIAAALKDHGGSLDNLDGSWSLNSAEIMTMPVGVQKGLRKVYDKQRTAVEGK